MKKVEFYEKVKTEVDNIKKYATASEINRLVYKHFDPEFSSDCIYGLMTGYCMSKRGLVLIKKCATLEGSLTLNNLMDEKTYASLKKDFSTNSPRSGSVGTNYFSYLEGYILLKKAKNKSLFKYLKSEIDVWNP